MNIVCMVPQVGPVGILVLGLIATHSMALLLDASTVLRKK